MNLSIYGNDTQIDPLKLYGIGSQSNNSWSFDTAFDKGNIGTTLSGIGQGIGLISGIYGAMEDRKMRNRMYDLEKKRVERNQAKEDKFHDDMTKAWS